MRVGIPYTAGIIDGEGSILLTRKKANENRTPCITVPSTTFEIVNALWCTFGGGISSKRTTNPRHSPSWVWALEGHKVLELLNKIQPFLIEPKKAARAKFLVHGYKTVTVRNGRYTDKQLQAKKDFEKQFFKL